LPELKISISYSRGGAMLLAAARSLSSLSFFSCDSCNRSEKFPKAMPLLHLPALSVDRSAIASNKSSE
jgi:hypothetical protein